MQKLIYIPPIRNKYKFLSTSYFIHQSFGDVFLCNLIEQEDDGKIIISILEQIICITETPKKYESLHKHILCVPSLEDFRQNPTAQNSKWNENYTTDSFSELCNPEFKDKIIESWENAFHFRTAGENTQGLREPQIGALHAIHSHFTTEKSSIQTVVLPTGTGKTETMLASVFSKKVRTCLVVVPSDALRTQISEKFIRLGILRTTTVIDSNCHNPIVFVLNNNISSLEEINQIFTNANVVVTTIHNVGNLRSELLTEIAINCDLLVFDEAHHESAKTWRTLSSYFQNKNILQFTATPYRNDQKEVQGKIVYNFPLKKAQEMGYFSKINFESICIFDTQKADRLISQKAVERLRNDIANGYDHLLMARTSKIERAEEVFEYYKDYQDLKPVIINSHQNNIQAIKDQIIKGNHKIIICVNMLGEGFDLPQLKIAALHDNHKSLPVFLQFIGRFARNRADLGEAYVVANIDNEKISEELEEIWNSTDWDTVLKRISSEKIDAKIEFQEFLKEYKTVDQNFPIQSLRPTLSTLVYDLRFSTTYWRTSEIEKHIQGEIVYKSNSYAKKTFICITEIRNTFDWIDNDSVIGKAYNLYIFHYDEELKLLFVSGGGDKSELKNAIVSLCAEKPILITGENVFRCFYGINRVKLTNMGLYTALQNGRSYMQYLGRSVNDTLTDTEKIKKSKGNFFGNGYDNGVKISIGCSVKGRIWSFSHDNLLNYTLWCKSIGKKLIDESITQDEFLKGFLIPEKIKKRPEFVPIAIDWQGDTYSSHELSLPIYYGKKSLLLFDLDLSIKSHDSKSDLEFNICHEDVVIATIKQEFIDDTVKYTQVFGDTIYLQSKTITQYFDERNPRIWFENSNYLEGDLYFALQGHKKTYFSDDYIKVIDWLGLGVDIKIESQGFKTPIQNSIQYQTIKMIYDDFDIIFNDDNSGEIADIVAIKVEDKYISIYLYHCKFSKEDIPNSAITNFYEVCGQAQKCIRKIDNRDSFFKQLKQREESKQKKGYSRFVKGDYELLNKIQNQSKLLPIKFEAVIVQPGLSYAKITDDVRVLLGNTQLFLNETNAMNLTLFCSK